MKRYILILLLIGGLKSYGQDISSTVLEQPVKILKKDCDFISTDRLGNLYLVKNNFIWMYDRNGDSLRSFNTNRYGQITFIDCTDPYKILVFFQNYNVVLFLDNYLSENGPIMDMQSMGFDQVTLVCLSQEKGFWVFDQLKQKIMRLDGNFQKTHETVNFIQWFGQRLKPSYMIQNNNLLYLNEKDMGIYVFDNFGTYIRTIPIKGLDNLQMLEGIVSFVEDGKYCNYRLLDLETKCDELQRKTVFGARKEKGRFYLHSNRGVEIFKTK